MFLELKKKATTMQPKLARQKMLLKQNPANIRKWIARFYYFRHLYSAGSACVLLTIIVRELPIDMGKLHLHRSLTYSQSLPAVLHSIHFLWGWTIPFEGVCQSGEAALSTPEAAGFTHHRQTVLMCNRRRPAATSSRRASFSALASITFAYFGIEQQHHADASACQ